MRQNGAAGGAKSRAAILSPITDISRPFDDRLIYASMIREASLASGNAAMVELNKRSSAPQY
jgi:hypothetical protein